MKWVEILERLKEARGLTDKQVAALERRNTWRIYRRVPLVGFRQSGERLDLTATNFGPGGLRAEGSRRLRKMELLKLRVDESSTDDILVRVQWCRKHRDAPLYEAGMQFMGSAPEHRRAAARFLLEDCKVGVYDPKEKRRAPRAMIHARGYFTTADGLTTRVTVVDLAVGGALLSSPRPLERTMMMEMQIYMDEGTPLYFEGTVVRCRPAAADTYELGILFTRVADDYRDRLIAYLSLRLLE